MEFFWTFLYGQEGKERERVSGKEKCPLILNEKTKNISVTKKDRVVLAIIKCDLGLCFYLFIMLIVHY